MTKIEIALIICAVLTPFLAIIFVLPKHKKKSKQLPETKPYVPSKQENEEKPKSSNELELPKSKSVDIFSDDKLLTDDYKEFLKKRNSGIVPPSRRNYANSTTFSFDEYMNRKKNKEESKTIHEEIDGLSPELKAMLVAGVLDRKYFD